MQHFSTRHRIQIYGNLSIISTIRIQLTILQMCTLCTQYRKQRELYTIYYPTILKYQNFTLIILGHFFVCFFSSGSTTSIELTFYSVLYAFPYFPRSWEGFKQGIRIKGREVTLVWHEQASRTALQTSSLLHTHTPSVQTHNMTTYIQIAEKCSQL